MRSTFVISGALVCVGLNPLASADIILGVTASTDMGSGFTTDIQNTVNGLGLAGGIPDLNGLHEGSTPGNSWVADATITGTVTLDLGGLFTVDSFSFWNQNGGGPGADGSTGIRDVLVEFSTDGTNFTTLIGGPSEFAQVPGSVDLAPEIVNFASVGATHFRLNIMSNWGDLDQTGFAEIHFNSVPGPPVLALVGLGALMASRRRRR
jgi:hypothetical protein